MADNTSPTSGSSHAKDQGGAKRSNLNSAIAQRQKLLLGGIGAAALIAGSMFIFGGGVVGGLAVLLMGAAGVCNGKKRLV